MSGVPTQLKRFGPLAVLILTLAAAQNSASTPRREFEVASIRVHDGEIPIGTGGRLTVSASQLTIQSIGLSGLIDKAFGARFKSSDRPVPNTMLDIRAKMPEGATADQIPEMLRTLLEERFGLSAHWSKQVKKVTALKVDGVPKLTRSTDLNAGQPGFDMGFTTAGEVPGLSAPNGGTMRLKPVPDRGSKVEVKGGSLAYVAMFLSRLFNRDPPFVDSTGLRGYFDFTLTFSAEDIEETIDPARANNPPPDNPTGKSTPSLRDSLKPLGLKLEVGNQPVDVLIIDHVNSFPTEN